MLLDSQILKTDVDHTQAARDSFARILAALGRPSVTSPASEESPETPLRGRAAALYLEGSIYTVKPNTGKAPEVLREPEFGVDELGANPFSSHSEAYLTEHAKSLHCGRVAVEFECGCGHHFWRKIACHKHWCPTCGNVYEYYRRRTGKKIKWGMKLIHKGFIHQKRIARWSSLVDFHRDFFRQFVFPAPAVLRERLLDREEWKAYCHEVKEFLRLWSPAGRAQKGRNQKTYQGKYAQSRKLVSTHPHGDDWHLYSDLSDLYTPHLNVLILGDRFHERWVVPKEELDDMRRAWTSRLKRRYPQECGQLKSAVLHYRFVADMDDAVHARKMRKTISYMSRPWDPAILRKNTAMAEFLVVSMKGFNYVDQWGNWRKKPVRKPIQLCPVCKSVARAVDKPVRVDVILAEIAGHNYTEDDRYIILHPPGPPPEPKGEAA